jgi:hypothetical protein
MRIVERFLIMVAIVTCGSLLFVSVSRSRQKVPAAGPDAIDPPGTAVVTAAAASAPTPAPSFTANSFCMACHLDFDEEELALDHEVFGVGCERCHGESLRHRSDEANITPPELMYAKERINPMCMMCHPRQDIRDTKEHLPILEAGLSTFEEAVPTGDDVQKYCTDCHGHDHHMKVRTIRWDKATGTLLPPAAPQEPPPTAEALPNPGPEDGGQPEPNAPASAEPTKTANP